MPDLVCRERLAHLVGVVVEAAELIDAGARFDATNLTLVNLRGADLRWVDMRDADLIGVILENANLHGADFKRADLTAVNLKGADLGGVCVIAINGGDLIAIDLQAPVTLEGRAELDGQPLIFSGTGSLSQRAHFIESTN